MSQAITRPVVRWRLGARTRKSVLLVHIASAGAWLGIDVVMAVLVFTALVTDDDRTKALSFQALELVAVGRCSPPAWSACSAASWSASAAVTGSSDTGGWRPSWP